MKEYSKGIYIKFKPEEVEILHNRMKEAGVQNMSAYIRKRMNALLNCQWMQSFYTHSF